VHLAVWLLTTLEGTPLDGYLLRVTGPTLGTLLVSPLIHLNGWHLLVNLLILLAAGGALETRWGSLRFAAFSMVCIAGGAVVTVAFAPAVTAPWTVSCGSSSVAFGALAVVGLEFPERRLFGRLPPLRFLVWGLIFLLAAFLMCLHETEASGYRLLLLPHTAGVALGMLFVVCEPWTLRLGERWCTRREVARRGRVMEIRERVDGLLDKISAEGSSSLTRSERTFLARASKHYRDS
jgi:membrane associated rhomboid family serine protease